MQLGDGIIKNCFYILEQAIDSSQEKTKLEKILELLNNIKNSYELAIFLIGIIVVIILIIVLCCNKKIVNKKSKKEYEKNEKNKKFIDSLYVELGNCNEKLRYMFYSSKWKKRIRNEFKLILKTNVGNMLKKECNIRFYSCVTLKGLYKSLKKCYEYLENYRNLLNSEEEKKSLVFYIGHNGYFIKDEIYRLIECTEMMNNNVCFLLGKAGSGKTNLLTYYAKYLLSIKAEVIYMDAKNVTNGDVESKFLSYFHTGILLKENRNILIKILLFIKKIFNNKIVVIIEAINKNSNMDFYKDLTEFINKYSKYKNIKIIVSSRTEFYNLKFKKIFDENLNSQVKSKIISIETTRISENIHEKMYLKYNTHFNFKGTVTNSVKRVLFESPIFMRIFFECYANSDANITDINKSKIFSEYISNLNNNYPGLNKILDEIIEHMLNTKKFDYVFVDYLNTAIEEIKQLIFENVLLTHSIVENDGQINETKKEVILITYDEIRDYLITNLIIEKHKKGIFDVIEFIDEMIKQSYPISEGVIKRLYIYFKEQDNTICKYILSKKIFNHYNYGNNDIYHNMNLELIFSSRKELCDFEKSYLLDLEYIEAKDLAKMIYDSTYNLLYGMYPSVEFIVDRIKKYISNEEKVYDFYKIHPSFYRNIIDELKKYNRDDLDEFILILKKLLKYLEENYNYEKDY